MVFIDSIFDILNILFSWFIIALFFRHRVSGQDSFSGGDRIVLEGGGYLPGEDGRGGEDAGGGGCLSGEDAFSSFI